MSKGGMISIDQIVREAIADEKRNTLQLYPTFLHYALRMHRTLNIDYSEDIKTVKLPVSATKTVAYPDDYIAYSKLGVKIGDRMMCFVRDNTITFDKEDAYTPNGKFFDKAASFYGNYYFYNYAGDDDVDSFGNMANFVNVNGYAHNGVGYFKPNNECKEFQLSSEVNVKEVLLEYICNSNSPDSETFVNIMAADVIREYVHYQHSRFKKSAGVAQVRDDERKWLDALAKYNMRLSDVSFEGILDASRRSASLRPKG
jgi:hypothetical protein